MRQLLISKLGCPPLYDLETAPVDQHSSVGRKEFLQHFGSVS